MRIYKLMKYDNEKLMTSLNTFFIVKHFINNVNVLNIKK